MTDDQGAVLLARLSDPDDHRWTLPGGGIELGEEPADAAAREVQEESGYRVAPGGAARCRLDRHARAVRCTAAGHPDRVSRTRLGGELCDEVGGSTDVARWHAVEVLGGIPRVELVDAALVMAGIAHGV
ncbi:NUDIX domain-containing protein [Cellulomonas sp. JH27-2]|uniref:NUDIX domain-containing protein n=1 Tax=Cellulomonas sp. JH27-2 TaxID=2774139 RepID=UPI00351B7035